MPCTVASASCCPFLLSLRWKNVHAFFWDSQEEEETSLRLFLGALRKKKKKRALRFGVVFQKKVRLSRSSASLPGQSFLQRKTSPSVSLLLISGTLRSLLHVISALLKCMYTREGDRRKAQPHAVRTNIFFLPVCFFSCPFVFFPLSDSLSECQEKIDEISAMPPQIDVGIFYLDTSSVQKTLLPSLKRVSSLLQSFLPTVS